MLQTGMPIAHSAGASTSGVKSGDDTRWKPAADLLERAITTAEKSRCLQQIAEMNMYKLKSRKATGKLQGDGDNR